MNVEKTIELVLQYGDLNLTNCKSYEGYLNLSTFTFLVGLFDL